MAKRVGIFGWGVVAPKSPDIETFRNNLEHSNTWLEPFEGFGPNNFLAGNPEFCFDRYAEWINARFPPRHFRNLKEKMDSLALYALGAFIQALGQNRGLEAELKELAGKAHVYVGTGLGSLETTYRASVALYEAQKQWNRFWAQPERNAELRRYLASGPEERLSSEEIPAPPEKSGGSGTRQRRAGVVRVLDGTFRCIENIPGAIGGDRGACNRGRYRDRQAERDS